MPGFETAQLPQGHPGLGRRIEPFRAGGLPPPELAPDHEGLKIAGMGALPFVHAKHQGDRMKRMGNLKRTGGDTAVGKGKGLRHVLRCDPGQCRLLLIHHEAQARARRWDRAIDFHHVSLPAQARHELLRRGALGRHRGEGVPGNLGHQGAEHRGPRRHLDHAQDHPLPLQGRQKRPEAQHDGMGLMRALRLRHKYQAKLGQLRTMALVIAPHQTIEIHRRGHAGKERKFGHLGNAQHLLGHAPRHRSGALEAGPLGQIDQDLHLIFVVEGQQLQGHGAEKGQETGQQKKGQHAPEQPATAAALEHGGKEPAIGAGALLHLRGRRPHRSGFR